MISEIERVVVQKAVAVAAELRLRPATWE